MIRVCIQCEISKGSGISCANIKAGRRDLTTLIAKSASYHNSDALCYYEKFIQALKKHN